jgi:hypothetical protein
MGASATACETPVGTVARNIDVEPVAAMAAKAGIDVARG